MKEEIIEKVKELLVSGTIRGFVAPRLDGEHVAPHVFTNVEELDDLSLGDLNGGEAAGPAGPGGARYSLVKLLSELAARFPNQTFGILVRGCDERAIRQLMTGSRVTPLNKDRVIPVGFPCPAELAEACRCEKPWPDALTVGEPARGMDSAALVLDDPLAELAEWDKVLERCIKCFGCRNICPVCDCRECTMELESMVPQRELPPSRSFLMTRAVHMIDRCVYCGLCEQVCPAEIPLKSLYRLVGRIMAPQTSAFTSDSAASQPPL